MSSPTLCHLHWPGRDQKGISITAYKPFMTDSWSGLTSDVSSLIFLSSSSVSSSLQTAIAFSTNQQEWSHNLQFSE